MIAMKYPNHLATVMKRAGVNGPTLAKLADTSKQQVHKFQKGERELTAAWAQKFAPFLDVDWPALIQESKQSDPLLPNTRSSRLKAARWACWEEPEVAAATMKLDLNDLLHIEASGDELIPPVLLTRFCLVTGTPLRWIEAGEMTGMDPAMAARIAMFAPELIPERPKPWPEDGRPKGQNGGSGT